MYTYLIVSVYIFDRIWLYIDNIYIYIYILSIIYCMLPVATLGYYFVRLCIGPTRVGYPNIRRYLGTQFLILVLGIGPARVGYPIFRRYLGHTILILVLGIGPATVGYPNHWRYVRILVVLISFNVDVARFFEFQFIRFLYISIWNFLFSYGFAIAFNLQD